MHQGIYDRLVELARQRPGRLTTYSEVAPLAGLSMQDAADRNQMTELLSEILLYEFNAGRPLLTAIVVHYGNDNNPGEGFFSLAEQVGRYGGSRDPFTRLEFWFQEVRRVHDHWVER